MEYTNVDFLGRTMPYYSAEGLEYMKNVTIGIAGCGGVGGAYAMQMARLGIEKFVLADPANFDLPDINRQWGAFNSSLGKHKLQVYEEILLSINPNIKIKRFNDGLTDKNVIEFIKDCDIIADCLDIKVPSELRNKLYIESREKGLYVLSFPIIGFGGLCAISDPNGESMDKFISFLTKGISGKIPKKLTEIFGVEHIELIQRMVVESFVPSNAIAPAFTANLAAMETLLILLKEFLKNPRTPVTLPNIIAFEPYKLNFHLLNINDLN
ncbi:MAG: hypothetical protein HOO91_04770 [Bacteroidales bacterium]|nr:hypothetical protein [Bacteroidales bacterium]